MHSNVGCLGAGAYSLRRYGACTDPLCQEVMMLESANGFYIANTMTIRAPTKRDMAVWNHVKHLLDAACLRRKTETHETAVRCTCTIEFSSDSDSLLVPRD